MKKDLITQLHTSFERIVHAHPETGVEFWFARDLQPILGYAKWENFIKVIEKAKAACANTGHAGSDHFLDVRKMVPLGSGAQREIEDIAQEHVKNNSDVRSLLTKRGIVPEQLPAAEDVKKIERRLGSEAKKISKSVEPLDNLPSGMDDA